ncbi:hypothetical protein QO179_25070 [Bacillus stercoris]|nr:hypothetical protein [Bacillus stercoris]
MKKDIDKSDPREIKPGSTVNHGRRSAPKTKRPPKPSSQNINPN